MTCLKQDTFGEKNQGKPEQREENQGKSDKKSEFCLETEHLGFTFPRVTQDKKQLTGFLKDISFQVRQGEFVTLCGQNGCGKSTLLRLLKKEISPAGQMEGTIRLFGRERETFTDRELAGLVGFVGQNPEHQCVTDKVWHEIAFGLENMGVVPEQIRRRIAGITSCLGIEDWFDKRTDELSGGQRQLVNLASVLVMQPRLLLLDEPTGQLDPIAAERLLQVVQKFNREFGLTVIIAEHNPEETVTESNRVIWMKQGRVIFNDSPGRLGLLAEKEPEYLKAMPYKTRFIYAEKVSEPDFGRIGDSHEVPADKAGLNGAVTLNGVKQKETVLEIQNLWFQYIKTDVNGHSGSVLRGTNLNLRKGEIYCLLGGNGSGKTTLLRTILGLCKPNEGKIKLYGKKISGNEYEKFGYLPQNVECMFVTDCVEEDWKLVSGKHNGKRNAQEEKTGNIQRMELTKQSIDAVLPGFTERVAKAHPYDLSGGERQLTSLVKLLLKESEILLLDEPVKGLDVFAREQMELVLKKIRDEGKTILIVTHDTEFAASCADRCGLFFRGEVITEGDPDTFFRDNIFYTTAASRFAQRFTSFGDGGGKL